FSLGGKVLVRGDDVTADTGTSWINVPNRVVDKITRATGAEYDFTNDMYTVDCSVTGLPDFVFTFGGKDYPLTQADYLLAVGAGKCAVKIYAQDLIGGWLVGDTFMRPYCHVYDIGKRRIGLAKSKH
ncbi:ASP-1 protein, partial [Aphelenchoides avenae]